MLDRLINIWSKSKHFSFIKWPNLEHAQGVQIKNCQKWMAVKLKRCIFDPLLVKPKYVWEVVDFFENCKQTAENCKQIFGKLEESTASQTHFGFSFLVLQPFTFDNFQSEHHVHLWICWLSCWLAFWDAEFYRTLKVQWTVKAGRIVTSLITFALINWC